MLTKKQIEDNVKKTEGEIKSIEDNMDINRSRKNRIILQNKEIQLLDREFSINVGKLNHLKGKLETYKEMLREEDSKEEKQHSKGKQKPKGR